MKLSNVVVKLNGLNGSNGAVSVDKRNEIYFLVVPMKIANI